MESNESMKKENISKEQKKKGRRGRKVGRTRQRRREKHINIKSAREREVCSSE